MAACIVLMISLADYSTSKEWRGITPLHSTRTDVLRILGPADKSSGSSLYQLENETVLISYSTGKCNEGGIWDVPRDTVTRISVSPKKVIELPALQLDLRYFKVVASRHLQGFLEYTNSEEGIYVLTFKNEVNKVEYIPGAIDNHLRCNKLPPFEIKTKEGLVIDSHALFDSYSDISFKEEKVRLDVLGRKLREEMRARGYIVIYPSDQTPVNKLLVRAKRAKEYLLKEYNLLDDQVDILTGERRKESVVELYFIIDNVSSPSAHRNEEGEISRSILNKGSVIGRSCVVSFQALLSPRE